MKKFKTKFLAVLMTLAVVVGSFGLLTNTHAANVITIVHTNDMHGRIEKVGDAYRLSILAQFVEDNAPDLVIDAGDAMQGLAIANSTYGANMAEAMTLIPYDYMTAGNHEFDFGYDVAAGNSAGYRQVLDNAGVFPIISDNVINEATQEKFFDGYTIHTFDNGSTALIMGLTTPETAYKTDPRNVEGLVFEDPIPVAKEIISQEKDNVDVVIVMAHLGIDKDTPEEWRSNTLAQALADDTTLAGTKIVIIDGHSHTPMSEGEYFGDNVLLAQTGEYINNIGYLTIDLDDFAASEATLVPVVETMATNPEVDELLDGFVEDFSLISEQVIYEDLEVTLDGSGVTNRTQETNLGKLIADAAYLATQTGFSTPADFAIINGGGIRDYLNPGDLTYGDILSVLPFGNLLASIEVTGPQIYQMFEHSVRNEQRVVDGEPIFDVNGMPLPDRNGGFLQVSDSVRVVYDTTQQGRVVVDGVETVAGERVLAVYILDNDLGEYVYVNPEDESVTYRVAAPDFLAVGGDGYDMLGGQREEGQGLFEIFLNHLQNEDINWDNYKEDLEPTRLITQPADEFLYYVAPVNDEVIGERFGTLFGEALVYHSFPELFTEESFAVFEEVYLEAEVLFYELMDKVESGIFVYPETLTNYVFDQMNERLEAAILQLEEVEEPVDPPVDPEPPVPVDPIEPPPTGIDTYSSYYLFLALASMGTIGVARKRKN